MPHLHCPPVWRKIGWDRRQGLLPRSALSSASLFRSRRFRPMRWCSLVLAPRAVWCRPLSVDKSPSLMTYAAGPQMYRTRRQVRRGSVGNDAPGRLRCRSAPASLDHLVGEREQPIWSLEAERLGGLEVDDQFEKQLDKVSVFFSECANEVAAVLKSWGWAKIKLRRRG